MERYCDRRNVQDLLADGKTPYEKRSGEPLKGPVIPFGATVEYYPISARDQSRLHQFGKNVLPGIFLGYALDASETHARRLSAKEVLTSSEGDFFASSRSQMEQLDGLEELMKFENPL